MSLVGDRLEERLRPLAEVMLPLQDRAARMMDAELGSALFHSCCWKAKTEAEPRQ
jgi:hypothetical protein